MALAADQDGFLQGDPIHIDRVSFARALTVLQDIKSDTGAIRSALYRRVEQASRPQAANAPVFSKRRGPAVLPQRDSTGRFIKAAEPIRQAVQSAASSAARAATKAAVAEASKVATPARKLPNRAASGRFLSAAEKQAIANGTLDLADLDKPASPRRHSGGDGLASSGIDLRGAAGDTLHGVSHVADGLDPAVAAAKELHAIATPLLSPALGLGKRMLGIDKDPAVPWYRRIWNELRELNKRDEGRGGGMLGLLASLVTAVLALPGKLARSVLGFIPRLLGFGGGGGGGGMGGLLGGGLKLGRMARFGKAMKIGGPLAALLAGGEIWQTEHDSSLTRAEKTRKNFGSVGGAAGGLLGGAAGFALGGPVGAAIGGVIGNIVGEKVGDKLSEVDWKGVGEHITASWDKTVKALSDFFGPVIDKAEKAIKPAVEATKKAAKQANEAVKAATGVDVAKTAGEAVDKGKEIAGKAVQAAKKAGDWVLGQTSKLFESGKGGAATVSSGKGDRGGASYGTYQLASKTGTLQDFLKTSKYGKDFDGLKPGTPEFNAKWKEVAAQDPAFGQAQHDYIKATHFDPQMAKLKKAGIDLSGRGAAVQDAVWSTSVQFGGKSSLIQKALKGKDVASMSDADIASAIQDYKAANNDTLFGKSSAAVRKGTLARAGAEKQKLLALASSDVPAIPAASKTALVANLDNVASPAAPVVPSSGITPVSVTVPAAQPVTTPLGSNARTAPAVLQAPREVGQNPHDRAIAQIATGGLGSYM